MQKRTRHKAARLRVSTQKRNWPSPLWRGRNLKRQKEYLSFDQLEMKRSGQTHHHGHRRCRKCGARTPEPKLDRRVWKHCKNEFNRTCLYEHQKWHCASNPNRKTRSFSKKKCPQCNKSIHEKSFARHMKTHSRKERKSSK